MIKYKILCLFFEVSTNVLIAKQCFDMFGGECSPWLRAWVD